MPGWQHISPLNCATWRIISQCKCSYKLAATDVSVHPVTGALPDTKLPLLYTYMLNSDADAMPGQLHCPSCHWVCVAAGVNENESEAAPYQLAVMSPKAALQEGAPHTTQSAAFHQPATHRQAQPLSAGRSMWHTSPKTVCTNRHTYTHIPGRAELGLTPWLGPSSCSGGVG